MLFAAIGQINSSKMAKHMLASVHSLIFILILFLYSLTSMSARAAGLQDLARPLLAIAQICGDQILRNVIDLFFDEQGRIDYDGATKSLHQTQQRLAAIDSNVAEPVGYLVSQINTNTTRAEYEALAATAVNEMNRQIVWISERVAKHEGEINALESRVAALERMVRDQINYQARQAIDTDAHWSYQISGSYIGYVGIPGQSDPIVTNIFLAENDKLGGTYLIYERGRLVDGSLEDAIVLDATKVSFTWRDIYGYGTVFIDFNEDLTSFRGIYGEGGESPSVDTSWTGTK